MNSPLATVQACALAFLYEKAHEQCRWLRSLTPQQMQLIASLMMEWQRSNDHHEILPLQEVERREIFRALSYFEGNANKAAKSLRIGKTTLYRKLAQWGYTVKKQFWLAQLSALAVPAEAKQPQTEKSISSPRNGQTRPSPQQF
ncbi:MAG TPA: helix-turn-helix domain-containing protein [Terriglobales bacterium]|nr:helix-turn-helix domain-containing protein [Terriglobales bacterium]